MRLCSARDSARSGKAPRSRVPGTWVALVAAAALTTSHPVAQQTVSGIREASWSPDGKLVVVSLLDRLWTMTPDGRQARPLAPLSAGSEERDPVWSPDGTRIAFAAAGESGFDLFETPSRGGTLLPVVSMPGDERWPSWTPDGRLVFAHRPRDGSRPGVDPDAQWDLYMVAPVPGSGAWQAPVRLTDTTDSETYPRVAPDGKRVAFISNRESLDDVDVFAMTLPAPGVTKFLPLGGRAGTPGGQAPPLMDVKAVDSRPPSIVRVTRVRGEEAAPSWAPDSQRVAFYAVRDSVGSVWVAPVDAPTAGRTDPPQARPRPSAPPQLVSRAGGLPAWSPDGRQLLVVGVPDPQPVYNGNPERDRRDAPALFDMGRAFRMWRVSAPLPVHETGGEVTADLDRMPALNTAAFTRVWQTLRDLYYTAGSSADQWRALWEKYLPRAEAAPDAEELERVVDALVAEQPLIKPAVESRGAVVVSGHPLASAAGRLALEKGGNIVDAAIAVSFALGVVEPEASGVGGDGAAVLFLQGMARPTVIDYKDQTPIRATPDNPAILSEGRLVADGPAAANIPGVVAGLDYLYRRYGSGKVPWADLVEPAIKLADEGFVLDEALPTSIAVGRGYLEKHAEAARIYLPGGRVPRAGDRFVNKDYASTLRAIAKDGGDTFYRGALARKIADDLQESGGIITLADLAQYRAIEREPVVGQYRGHRLYAGGPPVSTGIQLFESLQILEHYQPRPQARVTSDADYFHHVIEAWKVRDPTRRVADPDRWPVDFAEHLTPAHAAGLFKKIDPTRASRYERAAEDDGPFQPLSRIGTGTTSFAVADAQGNMIAITQTLSTWGGTFYVSKGLGFLYNNHLRSSRLTPGYGSLVPLMRSSTASVPTLVFRQTPTGEVPRLAVGAAGNAWIPVSVYNIITGVIDGGLGAQAAIEAPRFLPGRDPADPLDSAARIEIEDRFARSTLETLSDRGHRFQKIGRKGEVRYGYASAVLVDAEARRVEGGAEPRRSHAASAYEPNR